MEDGMVSDIANQPDPDLQGDELPTFRFALEKSEGKRLGGSYGKEATVKQLPISKGIAGVSMRLEPGVMRELHWHATAAERAFIIEGRCRTTVIDPQGRSEVNDIDPGDIWYLPRGYGHSIQCLGDEPCHFVLVFDKDKPKDRLTCEALNSLEIVGKHDLCRSERVWDLG
jgi:oxalate decarboxylase